MTENKAYNEDVADIFIQLVKSYKVSLVFLTEGEIKRLAMVAKELTANKPQSY
jgi:hypothetical protein